MTYGCQLPQERVLQYIHFNRYHNTMMINKLREDMIKRFSCQAPWTKLSTGCYMYVWIVNNNLVSIFKHRDTTKSIPPFVCVILYIILYLCAFNDWFYIISNLTMYLFDDISCTVLLYSYKFHILLHHYNWRVSFFILISKIWRLYSYSSWRFFYSKRI